MPAEPLRSAPRPRDRVSWVACAGAPSRTGRPLVASLGEGVEPNLVDRPLTSHSSRTVEPFVRVCLVRAMAPTPQVSTKCSMSLVSGVSTRSRRTGSNAPEVDPDGGGAVARRGDRRRPNWGTVVHPTERRVEPSSWRRRAPSCPREKSFTLGIADSSTPLRSLADVGPSLGGDEVGGEVTCSYGSSPYLICRRVLQGRASCSITPASAPTAR